MSAHGRALRCAVVPNVYSGSLSGTGTLAIPASVLSVTVTGAGAPGGDNTVSYPGQPFIAEVPYTPRTAIAGSFGPVFFMLGCPIPTWASIAALSITMSLERQLLMT